MNDFVVKVEYMNKNMETVIEKEYPFVQYAELISNELTAVITDVENAFYAFENGEQKENWTPENLQRFKEIRHKLLDHANAIRRLPRTLSYKGIPANTINFSEALASAINQGYFD